MNPVEIEEALTRLTTEQAFDAAEFPYAFLEAFGNKKVTVDKLRKGASNKSDIPGAVLQQNHIHLATCPAGETGAMMARLRQSPATLQKRHKCKFILATDGTNFEAEDLISGEFITDTFARFAEHFGFFLPLAGISKVSAITESVFDVRATGRLNRLYTELLKENPSWGTAERRKDMNHFMARLIFCFYAEDTRLFPDKGMFTACVKQMCAADGSDTHEVLAELFRAMNIPTRHEDAWDERYRKAAGVKSWAARFPYVNGGLFSGEAETPRFSKVALTYLLNIGALDWEKVNPDIFGSMIQAVTEEDERGKLGMHYTSVPNILKVLNPLFLDELQKKLDDAETVPNRLKALRKRLARIRVFDPACGSGNFLVIAYKQLRNMEAVINERLGEKGRRTVIPLTNFRGIELKGFPAEVARLALVIAKYQCDVLYSSGEVLAQFLPLDKENWIIEGNALRLDWLQVCPPYASEEGFEHEGSETYICGNPPYIGSTWQTEEQKSDLKAVFHERCKAWKSLDYVSGWFMKAADYGQAVRTTSAFVSTNSICQGQQVPILWPLIFNTGHVIHFAHSSFKWANLASHNAGVTVAIIGMRKEAPDLRRLYAQGEKGETLLREAENINAYLVAANNIIVTKAQEPLTQLTEMLRGNMPYDGGHLLLTAHEVSRLGLNAEQTARFIRRIYGSAEFIRGLSRYCLWIEDEHLQDAMAIEGIRKRIEGVRAMRLASRDKSANEMAKRAYQMREMNIGKSHTLVIPCVSSENRGYLPVGLIDHRSTVTNLAFALYDAPLWNLALLASRLHLTWIATVCGKLKTDFRYSNTLGWNTFPVPDLMEHQKEELTRCAEHILLAREMHFPKTIAQLYDPETMPENLRKAHDENDATVESIYIGRRFKNDTERLETLFKLYTEMTRKPSGPALKVKKPAAEKKPRTRKSA